jgi:2'-hydroxyisoflavone reductase
MRRPRILVVGGTRFVGPPIVEAALARGCEVVLFNRNRSNRDLFPDVRRIVGDRDGDLSALENESFDAVVDTIGFTPWQVTRFAQALRGRLSHYVFLSSLAALAETASEGQDESAGVATISDSRAARVKTAADVRASEFGALKARCEQALDEAMDGRVSSLRLGVVLGPRDSGDPHLWWPWRARFGGIMLAPQPADGPVQWLDVRDVGEFCLELIEDGHHGVFHTVGPAQPCDLATFLGAASAVSAKPPRLRWIPEATLREYGFEGSMIPFWTPRSEESRHGLHVVANGKALEAGLRCRDAATTLRDVMADLDAREAAGEELPFQAMLAAEAAVLRAHQGG